MDISLQEVLDILSKWKQERRLIHFYFFDEPEANESSCSGIGRIEELSPQSLRINARSIKTPRGDLYGCVLSLPDATFTLFDWRNAPPEQEHVQEALRSAYDLVLVVTLHARCICELRAVKLVSELDDVLR